MPITIDLGARLTYEYRTAYQYLDDWETIGPAKQTKLRELDGSRDSYDGGSTRGCLVIVPPQTLKAAERLYRYAKPQSTFNQWLSNQIATTFDRACQCEHDCCGHLQAYGVVRRIDGKPSKREFSVRVETYRNV